MQQIDMALTNIRGSDSLIFRGSQILYLFIFSFFLSFAHHGQTLKA